jgi:hypothetical protein
MIFFYQRNPQSVSFPPCLLQDTVSVLDISNGLRARVCYPVSFGTGHMEYKISHVMQIDPTAVQSKRHHHHINIYIIQVPCNQAKYMLPFVLYISQTTDYVD